MTIDQILSACNSGYAAIRSRITLTPIEGLGGKVYPPTYEGGQYATEDRRIGSRIVSCVLLDSIQAQSNKLESVLEEAVNSGRLPLPLFSASFENGKTVTTLSAPHRISDAIFRDCTLDGKPFRNSEIGSKLFASSASNATALFEYAPTVLIFGVWDSTDLLKRGTLRLARAVVSEIIGLDAQRGVKTSSRIDPLGLRIVGEGESIYKTEDGSWTFDPSQAKKEVKKKGSKTEEVLVTAKPSELNHGNVLPTITDRETGHGGVTISEALQTVVISLAQLRQLSFPDASGQCTADRNNAGRACLALLAVYAALLQMEQGYQLRSRCQLVPSAPPQWELVRGSDGTAESLPWDLETVHNLLQEAIARAHSHGLAWKSGVIPLLPTENLKRLVRQSDPNFQSSAS